MEDGAIESNATTSPSIEIVSPDFHKKPPTKKTTMKAKRSPRAKKKKKSEKARAGTQRKKMTKADKLEWKRILAARIKRTGKVPRSKKRIIKLVHKISLTDLCKKLPKSLLCAKPRKRIKSKQGKHKAKKK